MAKSDRLAKQLVNGSLELHRRRSWKKVPADAPFLIRVPSEEELLCACLIGQAGTDLGLVVVKGPDAFGMMRRAFLEGTEADGGIDACHSLMVSFERLGTVPDDLRRVLDAAGFQTRRENIAPFLSSNPAYRHPRALNRGEMRTLAWCLGGVFAAEDRGELRPAAYEARGRARKMLQVDVTGKLSAPQVTTRFVTPPAGEVVTGAAPVLLPEDLRDLERIDGSWIVGLVPMRMGIAGDPRTYCAVLIIDEETEQAMCANVVLGEDMSEAVSELVEVMREHGLPRDLIFTSGSFMAAAAPGLAAIDVSSSLDSEDSTWRTAASSLIEATETRPDGDGRELTDPRTLEDWKAADREFTLSLVEDFLGRDSHTPRAAKRYFGSKKAARRVQNEAIEVSAMPAFIEWFLADYRPTKRSQTYVETRLDREDLDPVERVFLEARRDAYLSFFRVVSCVPGASLEVEDLLSDRRFTLQDRALSGSGIEGYYLPLRLFRIADWYFPCVAGPPANSFHIDRQLAELEQLGMTLEPDVLRSQAHLMGRIWSWFLDAKANPPAIQNTDGDPLNWHTAEFDVANPALFVTAVEAHKDVIVDEPGAEWTWVREGGLGGPAGIGATTTLCRLQLIGDSLVAETNSARRMDTARKWLKTLPSVRFKSMRQTDVQNFGARPLDDRLPGPPPEALPPGMLKELERLMEEQSFRWLDQSIPALGDLTPRVACATKKGRRHVARLIRTMPPMGIPGGEIPAPRERMLSELGL